MIIPYPQTATGKAGKVILAAAGPGDPDLITVKAADALRQAEVVLIDRLVSEVILHRYVSAEATVIRVGKQCSRQVSTPQRVINDLLVKYALEGKRVVRLKGGDVSIFSNVLDELEALIANRIPYELIPGVTASLGAAAYSGIPLTARGYATSVRFLTYYKSDILTTDQWKDLAATSDTLVFYMSSGRLDELVARLCEHGVDPAVHIAVVQQATTCYQHVYECPVYAYDQQLKGKQFKSPSLVIIGKVVALHRQFQWLKNSDHLQDYFTPVGTEYPDINESNKSIKHVI
ncbi:hypothetical protein GCM10027051_21180 [Niabella terrae]